MCCYFVNIKSQFSLILLVSDKSLSEIPWQSSGSDLVLSLLRAQVQSPVSALRSHIAMKQGQKIKLVLRSYRHLFI